MDVLIAGAGIAGLSAGIAMAKTGHSVVIAERASELREIGAALSLWPNALAALDLLDAGDETRAAGVEAPTGSIFSPDGAPIVEFDFDSLRRATGGLPLVVLRGGLHAALLSGCERLGLEIRLGEAVESVRSDGRRVVATTSRGETTVDAVIGADGINSKVRAAVDAAATMRDCDRIAWRALIPDRDGLIPTAFLTVGVGLQLIASPAPDGLSYWAADTPGRDLPTHGPSDLKAILHRHFGGWHDPIPQIIDSTDSEALIVNRICDRPPPKALHRGPVLLVGDAGHAMTPDLGQGACQAIEDGAVLLACARARPASDAAELFASFERVRLPRVRQMVRDSYAVGRLAVTQSRVAAAARDAATRVLPESLTNRRLATYASDRSFGRQVAGLT